MICIYTLGEWLSLGIGIGLIAMIGWALACLFLPRRRPPTELHTHDTKTRKEH